jgi:hypothetical protein
VTETFRPSFAAYRQRIRGFLPGAILFGVIDFFRLRQNIGVYLAEVAVVVGVAAGFVALYFRNTRVESDARSLTIRNLFGLTHVVGERNVRRAVLATRYHQPNRGVNATLVRLFVLDEDGSAVLRWSSTEWTEEQMRSLVASIAVPLDELENPIKPKDFRVLYPRALSAIEAHPVAFGLSLAAAIIAITVAVVLFVISI